jgi:ABC-type Mn2+/Zn2+ transport system permease subunit
MTIFRCETAQPSYFKAFIGFFVVAALASLPAAEAQLVKQKMVATLPERLLLYAMFGAILSAIATLFLWWHRGSRRGLMTAVVIIGVFAFFGWRGGST